MLGEEINMRNVIEVDDGVELARIFKVLGRRGIGRKHDVFTYNAYSFAEHKLRITGAVHAAALFLEDLHQHRVGAGFHGVILFVPRVPGERLLQRPHACTQPVFIINMKRGGVFLNDGLNLRFVVR